MSDHNTWTDPRLIDHPAVDHADLDVREVAEAIHRNESLHRHDARGVTCIYCALNATRAVRTIFRSRRLVDERGGS